MLQTIGGLHLKILQCFEDGVMTYPIGGSLTDTEISQALASLYKAKLITGHGIDPSGHRLPYKLTKAGRKMLNVNINR